MCVCVYARVCACVCVCVFVCGGVYTLLKYATALTHTDTHILMNTHTHAYTNSLPALAADPEHSVAH